MPGLQQLKQFRDELDALGNELTIRAKRGEPADVLDLPENVAEDGDILSDVNTLDDIGSLDGGLPEDLFDDNNSWNADLGDVSLESLTASDPELANLLNLGTDESVSDEPAAVPNAEEPSFIDIDDALPDLDSLDSLFNTDESLDDIEMFTRDMTSDEGASFDIPDSPDTEESFSLHEMSRIQDTAEDNAAENSPAAESFGLEDDFSIPEDLLGGMADAANDSGMESPEDAPFSLDDLPDFSDPDSFSMDGEDFSMDLDDLGFAEPESPASDEMSLGADSPSTSSSTEEISLDDFDTAGFDDFAMPDDISVSSPAVGDDTGFGALDDLPSFDMSAPEAEDDFSLGDDFGDLPGIDFGEESDGSGSDNTAPMDDFDLSGFGDFDDPVQKSRAVSKGSAPQGTRKGEALSTEFTQEQYTAFLENLDTYPLNLKIAIEQMLSGDEFNEETTAALVHDVIQRLPAKALANKLGKTLDRIIDIPRDFEKRTASEYEASKTTLVYRLVNQILPAALIGLVSFGLIILLVFLTNRLIYRPLKAESLYKEGYALLEDEHYTQSLIKFDEAELYQPKKNWFFTFARGYRGKRQYGMAEQMYERILFRFDNDKTAGLEYARMELDDLLNYERAEEIVKRRVLDNYINDSDGMLLLGDIYMEWAGEGVTSTDAASADAAAKYESARSTYATLIQLYGTTDLYMSRMMRYFIRTDNLREVLPLRDRFYGAKKNPLEPQDMVELSGYLMDKLYGSLGVRDDTLAPYIEDVRSMLEEALLAAPAIPEAGYNMGRYFVYTNNSTAAKELFTFALPVFDAVPTMSPSRVIRNIDTYRLLGELYTNDLDYIKAEETYVAGIRLFEQEKNRIRQDQRIGHLFADIGDLDYFISGDLDQAFANYNRAVGEKWDIPSVRYKMGYIQYHNGEYENALGSFIKTIAEKPSDENTLFALANSLYNRGDYYAAQGYYERLVELLDSQRMRFNVFLPQMRADHGILVEHYMYAANNLGVVQYRLADQTGNSRRRAEAQVYFSESVRAWDALTRNPETLIRVDGTNLAAQNIRYTGQPIPEFEPEIYGRISQALYGEPVLRQNSGR